MASVGHETSEGAKMKTKEETVTQTVYLWAVPHSQWHREHFPDDGPFNYVITDSDYHYTTGSVKLLEHEVTLNVPAGIDLLQKAVETLKEEQVRVKTEANQKCNELQEQINSLLLLSHNPEPDDTVVATQ